jgi:hypothetical protein
MRVFTVEVPEPVIDHAIVRGLLRQEDRAEPWPVIQAWFAAFLSDTVLNWLIDNGVITREQRGDAGAILCGIRAWLEPHSASLTAINGLQRCNVVTSASYHFRKLYFLTVKVH